MIVFIEPGFSWETGYCKSVSSKLRDERLNGEIFYSHAEARIIKSWCQHDKTERPHSSRGYRLSAPAAVPGLAAQPKPASQANSNVADKPSMLLI